MAVTQSDSTILPGAAVFPGGQLTQTSGDRAALAAEKEPAGQLTQVVSEEAPHEPENVPAAHLVHSVAPSPDEYLPATQSPQPASSLAVVVAYLPMGQFVQADEDATEYVPAPHAAHALSAFAPCMGECFPGRQSTQASDPGSAEYLPATQFSHVVTEMAAATDVYLPAPQSAHSPDPLALLYLPATHAVQAPPSEPV